MAWGQSRECFALWQLFFPPRFLICWYLFSLPEEDSVKQGCKRWAHAAKD